MTKAAEARVAEEQLRHYGTHTYLTLSPLCLCLSLNCAVSECLDIDASWRRLSDWTCAAQPVCHYRGADKSLARPGRKQTTATEDFEVHISYL